MDNPIITQHKLKKEPYIHIYVKNKKTFELEYQGTSEDMSEMITTIIADTAKRYFSGDPRMTMAILFKNVMLRMGLIPEPDKTRQEMGDKEDAKQDHKESEREDDGNIQDTK